MRARRATQDSCRTSAGAKAAPNAMHVSSAGGFEMQPCIGMKTAQGTMQPGWLASQADMLASDWEVVS